MLTPARDAAAASSGVIRLLFAEHSLQHPRCERSWPGTDDSSLSIVISVVVTVRVVFTLYFASVMEFAPPITVLEGSSHSGVPPNGSKELNELLPSKICCDKQVAALKCAQSVCDRTTIRHFVKLLRKVIGEP